MPEPTDIKLIVFDVDGVLTDGSILIDEHGVESKLFHVRDGFAIRAAQSVGVKVGVLSGRASTAVVHRMSQLGVEHILQGQRDKLVAFETMCQLAHVDAEATSFVGDDLIDLPAMLRCGYPMAVADAVEEVKAVARYVTEQHGGRGAVREAIEHVLQTQGRWDEVVDRYSV